MPPKPEKKSISWSIRIAALLALAIGIAFWRHRSGETLEAVKTHRGPAMQAVFASGKVEAEVMLPIAPRSSARLIEILSDEGAEVRQGQTLARLEDREMEQNIEALAAKAQYAEKEYRRNAALVRESVMARKNFEAAEADYNAAKAGLEAARAQLDYLHLEAPSDGRIIRRDGEIGQLIPSGQAVFWFAGQTPMRIEVEVDEEDIPSVKVGQKTLIRADAFPGQIFEGTVSSITPKGDPIARSFRARVAISGQTPLQVGMTVEVNIVLRETADSMLLPLAALDGSKVWIYSDGRVKKREVKIGAKGKTDVEVLQGLSADDLAILRPRNLSDGDRARVEVVDSAEGES